MRGQPPSTGAAAAAAAAGDGFDPGGAVAGGGDWVAGFAVGCAWAAAACNTGVSGCSSRLKPARVAATG
jgi:hypothetical protein